MADEGQCRSCGAPIVWARHTATGKPMPLEEIKGPLFTIRGDVYGKVARPIYRSHYASCPDAPSWRKR